MDGYDVEVLRHAARKLGWPKYRVASEAGIAPATVTKLFGGQTVTATTVKKVADALDVDMADVAVAESAIPNPQSAVEGAAQ